MKVELNSEMTSYDAGLQALPGLVVVAIGADVVEVDRIRQVVARQASFVNRVFSTVEAEYCQKHRDPAERYAVRFAAKEAVLKALGVGLGGADFKDIEVHRLDTGQPQLVLSGVAQELAEAAGIERWLITLSHADTVAQAFVAGIGNGT